MELNLITGKDDLRPILKYIKVTKEKCIATNAHVLGIVPTNEVFEEEFIEEIPDDGFLIHSEEWKKLKGNLIVEWKTPITNQNGVIKVIFKKKRPILFETASEKIIGKYINWQAVIPQGELQMINKVGINCRLAYDLQKSLGADSGFRFEFYGDGKGIKCYPIASASKAYGLIMQVKIQL